MIQNDLSKHQYKVVVIGGGTGLPVILNQLKNKNIDITAIVNVADDGGSSGQLRQGMNIVPPGDIRNVLASLSTLPQSELDLFQYRFKNNDSFLSGHSLGNLIIAALTEMHDDVDQAVNVLSDMMKIKGHVYPATNEKVQLCAEFTDDTHLNGEYEITYAHKIIKRVWVKNCEDNQIMPHTSQKVIDAILSADQIVLGPGSLFTSILPNLMIENLGKAILKSKAQVVYICNIMTQLGETDHFTDADHVRVLNHHMHHNFIDVALVNKDVVPVDKIDYHKFNELAEPVQMDKPGLNSMGCRVVADDFLVLSQNGAFHDGKKVADELIKLLKE